MRPAASNRLRPKIPRIAQEVLRNLLAKMKFKTQIVEREPADLNGYDEQDEPTVVLDIRGDDLSPLIGRRGETLDGLQYLTRLLVAKELEHYLHIVLDVEGYKAHRAQTLDAVGAAHGRARGLHAQARRPGTHARQ